MMRVGVAAVFASAVVMATSVATAQQRADVTIRVANYGGAFTASQKKYAADLYTQRTGVKVQFVDGSGMSHVAKMIASKGREPPFDVVYLEEDTQYDAILAGVLAKPDPAIVTNMKFLYDQAKNKDGYGPGMLFYSNSIVYNYEKFKEAGIPEPASWHDLWNPKLAGRLIVPDLTLNRGFLIFAAKLKGGSEANPEPGIDYIAQLKPQAYATSSAMLQAALQGGEVWAAAMIINGRAWSMIDKGAPLRYVIPKEGALGQINTIDVVAGTKHPKEAQEYINMVLDPLVQLGQATEVPYGPTNKLLAPILAAYPETSRKFPASPQDLDKLVRIDWPTFKPNQERMMDMWNRKILNK